MKYKDKLPLFISLIYGGVIAAITNNFGNVLIFAGLFAINLFMLAQKNKIILNIGRLIYLAGIAWSFTLPLAFLLGWSSVFLTLLLGTFDFSKKLK